MGDLTIEESPGPDAADGVVAAPVSASAFSRVMSLSIIFHFLVYILNIVPYLYNYMITLWPIYYDLLLLSTKRA